MRYRRALLFAAHLAQPSCFNPPRACTGCYTGPVMRPPDLHPLPLCCSDCRPARLEVPACDRDLHASPQEDYIKEEQRNLKRELLRAQEEVKRIQAVPLVIGQFMEAVDGTSGIVGSTTGSNYYVRCATHVLCVASCEGTLRRDSAGQPRATLCC